MDWESFTTDDLEQQLVAAEALVSSARSAQLEILEELDRRQVSTGEGSRSLAEWLAARLDLSTVTSRSLVQTMRRTADHHNLRSHLSEGMSFDRVEALSKLPQRDPEDLLYWTDVNGVHRQAAKRAILTAETETRNSDDMFFVLQPNLDRSWWKTWGGLDGYTGELLDKTLTQRADQLPAEAKQRSAAWQRAIALAEACVADEPVPAQITVFVDTREASPTAGEAGITLDSGTRVGQRALRATLCDGNVEVIGRTEDGRLMEYGRSQRTAPPALKRALLAEAGHTCAVDGCTSRRRLQIHHLTPWAEGGRTDPDELVVLCWYHHHIAVHQQGLEPDLTYGRLRIRFHRKQRGPPS